MARLIIGCGRTDTIYYNPLYVDPMTQVQLGALVGWEPNNVYYQRGHPHPTHKVPGGDLLMDTEPLMHPDFVGSIIDPNNALLTDARAKNRYTEVIFENIPANVFDTNLKCATAFHHAYKVLQPGGLLSLRTGAPRGPGTPIQNALNGQGFHTIQVDALGTLTARK